MKRSILNSRFMVYLGLILIAISLAYLSTEPNYQIKEIVQEIKISNTTK